MEAKWTMEWPTEPGLYWFYGWSSKWARESCAKIRVDMVNVHAISNGVMYSMSGQLMFVQEGGMGYWTKADVPAAPTVDWVLFHSWAEQAQERIKNDRSLYRAKAYFNGDVSNPKVIVVNYDDLFEFDSWETLDAFLRDKLRV